MLKITGRGHYVGSFVSAIGQDGSWNILEGDEFVVPDAGTQPPQLGTGLEDYFNGAYYYTSLFDLPLHGLIEKGAMRTDQYRFHLLDAVSFNKSMEMGFEFGDRNRAQGYMSGVVYWYADRASSAMLPVGQKHLLVRPVDRFELAGMMSQLFLLERDGLYADAAARMEFFSERYRNQPWNDLFKVRALAYREKIDGFLSVKADYQVFMKSTNAAAAQASSDRLWLSEDSSHALLGIHALCKYKLKKNGEVIAEGEGRNNLRVLRTSVTAGEHIWDVELEPTAQGSFFSFCLRMQTGDITSAGEWETIEAVAFPDRPDFGEFKGEQVLPNMTVWAFVPNAYINMQSPAMGINLWPFWAPVPEVKSVHLRKKWTLEKNLPELSLKKEKERGADELKAYTVDSY